MSRAGQGVSLIDQSSPPPTIRVSSVLNREVNIYGKQCLTDRDTSTCWNSQPACPQTITVTWQTDDKDQKGVIVDAIIVMFQGGFVGKPIEVASLFVDGLGKLESVGLLHPVEGNAKQRLDVQPILQGRAISAIRLKMLGSTDAYGRIVIYDLDLEGHFVSSPAS